MTTHFVFLESNIVPGALSVIRAEGDDQLDALYTDGIVSKADKTLVHSFDDLTAIPADLAVQILYPNLHSFGGTKTSPTIKWNKVASVIYHIENIRVDRAAQFEELDVLQVRAISLGRTEVAKQIEYDKEALRNVTTAYDYDSATSLRELLQMIPTEVAVDYSDKYKDDLKL